MKVHFFLQEKHFQTALVQTRTNEQRHGLSAVTAQGHLLMRYWLHFLISAMIQLYLLDLICLWL